jgi:hypothetical protein
MLLEAQDTGGRVRLGSSVSVSPIVLTVALSLLALLVIVVRWYRPGYVIASVDLFPDYDPLNLLQKSFFAWNEGSAFGGFGFPTYTTYYFFNWIVGALSNPGIAQIADFWLFMGVAWLGAFVLCRALGFGLTACFLAAWSYVLNPAAQFLPPFITGSAYAAALPWFFWMVYRGAIDPALRRRTCATAVATCFLVISWIASTPQLFFELLLILAVWALFALRYAKPGFAVWALRTSLLCVAVSLWWIVPVLATMLGSVVTHATNSQDVVWSFKNASLLNNLRFVTAWTWIVPYFLPYANGYDSNIATYAFGFWGTAVLAVSLLFKRSRYAALVRFAVLTTLICFFITKGMHPPLEEINTFIYRIPGFFLFIEPGGFVVAACLMVSLAIGIVASELQERASSGLWNRVAAAAFAAGTIAAGLFSASPLLNGLIFSGLEWGGVRNYVAIPAYWFEAAEALDRAPGPGSVLVLPANDTYQTTYTWKYQGVDAIAPELIRRPVLMAGSSLNYFSDRRLDQIKNGIGAGLAFHSQAAASKLRQLGIRFILCRKDVVFRAAAEGNDCRSSFLAGKSSRRTYGNLVVYDLGDAAPPYALAGRTDVSVRSRYVAGFLHFVSVPPLTESATLTDLQFYHPTWYAIQIWPAMSFLAHRALGWQNAWSLSTGGEVLTFNAVNALELLFVALGASVTFIEIRRARAT